MPADSDENVESVEDLKPDQAAPGEDGDDSTPPDKR